MNKQHNVKGHYRVSKNGKTYFVKAHQKGKGSGEIKEKKDDWSKIVNEEDLAKINILQDEVDELNSKIMNLKVDLMKMKILKEKNL